MAGRLKYLSGIHRPVSTQDFEFITELNEQSSNFGLLKGRLSPD